MRARNLALTAVCVCLATLWLVLARRRPPGGAESSHRETPEWPVAGRGAFVSALSAWQARAAESPGPAEHVTFMRGHPNPIIERVRVDRLEVCVGEENFAHPDVHTVDGTDGELRIHLAGAGVVGSGGTGGKLPFRLMAATTPSSMPVVIVEGANGTYAVQRLPYVKVKDCKAAPPLRLEAQRVPDHGPDVFVFRATGAAPNSALVWDFGDGARVTTSEPRAEHDFGARHQRGRYSDFLVTAASRDPSGHPASRATTFRSRQPRLLGKSVPTLAAGSFRPSNIRSVSPPPRRAPGREMRVYFFVAVLGYSRGIYVRAFLRERHDDWREGLSGAFLHFGGVTQTVLVDNARALIIGRDSESGVVHVHPAFSAFCADWGVAPRACRPYRARTKGKTESGIGYVKRNAVAGRTFHSFAALETHLATWMIAADARIHGTTHERPIDRFERDERQALRPLPARPLPVRQQRLSRRVATDRIRRRRDGSLQRSAPSRSPDHRGPPRR